MPDNVTVYASSEQALSPAQLRPLLEGSADAVITTDETSLLVQWPQGWKIRISRLPAGAISPHLKGFVGFAHQLGASPALIKHIEQTKQVLGLVIEPGFEHFGYTRSLVLGITHLLDGIFFAGNAVYSKDNRLLFGAPASLTQFFPDIAPETDASLARRQRSIEILKQAGIPYIEHLPVIVDEAGANLRAKEDIALRAIALCLIAGLGMGADKIRIAKLVDKYAIRQHFTPKEEAFFDDPHPAQQDQAIYSWRIESYWTLLWALHFIEDLGKADTTCDVPQALQILQSHSRDSFVAQSRLRSRPEILDALDLTYRYHWATQESDQRQQAVPAGLIAGVIYERHYALNWLIAYQNADWDEVQTPT